MKKLSLALCALLAAIAFMACNSTAEKKPAAAKDAPAEVVEDIKFPAGVSLWEGFESEDTMWVAAQLDDGNGQDSSESLRVVEKNATEGKMSAELLFKHDSKDKASYSYASPERSDWTGVTQVKLDAFNNESYPIDLCMVLQNGEDWSWFQSAPVPLAPGANKDIVIDVKPNTPGIIKVVFICLFLPEQARDKTGRVFLDNIRVVK